MNLQDMPVQQAPAALANCSILVVDDSRTHRKLVETSLRQSGFCRISSAADGQQALDAVRADIPDLILLDIVMPVLDGFGVCEALRSRPEYADLPILVMTSLESVEHRLRALSVGATDVILKPVYRPQLVGHAISHLERRRMVRGLQDYQDRTATELAIARQMQEALLPDARSLAIIRERYGIDVGALFEPCNELGGDLWGIWPIDSSRIGIFVGDVAGHGTIAAINTFRIHTLLTRSEFDRSDPGRFLCSVNDALAPLLSAGQYVTMIYAVLDIREDSIHYAAAGCPEPLLASSELDVQGLDGSGLPLGIVSGTKYATRTAAFHPGSIILFHSDAFTEARLRADGELLGEAHARQLAAAAFASRSADTIISQLHQAIQTSTCLPLEDDLTLICIVRPVNELGALAATPSTGINPTEKSVLAVANTLSQRLMVKRAALHAGLRTDLAPDLATAGRFLAGNTYVAMVMDMQAPLHERMELLRIAAGVPHRPRLILVGSPPDDLVHGATSLGLDIVATLPTPLEIPATEAALLLSSSIVRPPTVSSGDVDITAADLEQALADQEITFGFQPIVALSTRQIMGAETLARWTSPTRGIVPATTLSRIADRQTAQRLADATLRAAAEACASWRAKALRIQIAVNLSAAALSDPLLPEMVTARLQEAGVPPDALIVEVPEAEALACLPSLTALTELGVRVAIDEFGLCDMGPRALERLPVFMLKMARSMIRNCDTDPRALRLLNVTTTTARMLGLTVGAVGIENYAVEQVLRSAGCDVAQGWLYGPAVAPQAIANLAAYPSASTEKAKILM